MSGSLLKKWESLVVLRCAVVTQTIVSWMVRSATTRWMFFNPKGGPVDEWRKINDIGADGLFSISESSEAVRPAKPDEALLDGIIKCQVNSDFEDALVALIGEATEIVFETQREEAPTTAEAWHTLFTSKVYGVEVYPSRIFQEVLLAELEGADAKSRKTIENIVKDVATRFSIGSQVTKQRLLGAVLESPIKAEVAVAMLSALNTEYSGELILRTLEGIITACGLHMDKALRDENQMRTDRGLRQEAERQAAQADYRADYFKKLLEQHSIPFTEPVFPLDKHLRYVKR